mmetsp:Transcript_66476/g.214828  ORF Transcript_66476/g.214828 Transcript_66476/m.214828 type:complete len:122 (+) Transcript_66476:620-985(+)
MHAIPTASGPNVDAKSDTPAQVACCTEVRASNIATTISACPPVIEAWMASQESLLLISAPLDKARRTSSHFPLRHAWNKYCVAPDSCSSMRVRHFRCGAHTLKPTRLLHAEPDWLRICKAC